MDDRSRQAAVPGDEMNRKAVASVMVAFIVLLLPVVVGIFAALIATWLGWAGRREIQRDGGRGMRAAVTGMVLGILGTVFSIYGIYTLVD